MLECCQRNSTLNWQFLTSSTLEGIAWVRVGVLERREAVAIILRGLIFGMLESASVYNTLSASALKCRTHFLLLTSVSAGPLLPELTNYRGHCPSRNLDRDLSVREPGIAVLHDMLLARLSICNLSHEARGWKNTCGGTAKKRGMTSDACRGNPVTKMKDLGEVVDIVRACLIS